MTNSINPNDAVILLEDIKRRNQGQLVTYGSRNELVKVISVSGETLIVEGKERFAVNIRQVRGK